MFSLSPTCTQDHYWNMLWFLRMKKKNPTKHGLCFSIFTNEMQCQLCIYPKCTRNWLRKRENTRMVQDSEPCWNRGPWTIKAEETVHCQERAHGDSLFSGSTWAVRLPCHPSCIQVSLIALLAAKIQHHP